MWEAIAGLVGILSTLLGYWLLKKRHKPTARDLLDAIEKEEKLRGSVESQGGLNALSEHDYKRSNELDVLLETNRDNPKR